MSQIERNIDYDFLRFAGISCIILAHVGVNEIIFQIRNFDVPLMILLSGISFVKFSSQNYSSYLKYIQSRFLRLVIPAWIFMILYDSAIFIYSGKLIGLKEIFMQLTLTGGSHIGVWIIRIFFTMALISPIAFKLNSIIKSNQLFFLYVIITWFFYEFAIKSSKIFLSETQYMLTQVVVFFTYSYGVMLMYGMRMTEISKKQLKKHIMFFLAIFCGYLLYTYQANACMTFTQIFKYPPQGYYVSYALLISLILIFLTLYTSVFDLLKKSPIIGFIGRSTMWIYLWHWPCLDLYNTINPEQSIIIKYILVFSSAALISSCQFNIIKLLQKYANIHSSRMLYLNKIFIG